MRRREVLARLGLAGAGAVVGAATATVLENSLTVRATPETFASTVSPANVRGGARVWWSGPDGARRLALTFDDGPTDQFTAHVLDALDAAGVHATFFVIGELVHRHPDLVRRARDAGHEIQNHSQDHLSAALIGRDAVRDAMVRGADAVEQVAGLRTRWFRPPRGEVTTATLLAARETGHAVAMWSVARDASGETADDDSAGVARHLQGALQPGDVVDLHDGIGRSSFATPVDGQLVTRRSAELKALPDVLRAWRDQGWTFARLSDLIPVTGTP